MENGEDLQEWRDTTCARGSAREAAGPQVGDKVDLDDGDLNDALEMF